MYPKFFFTNQNSPVANIILHGGSKGIESDFIRKIFDRSVAEGFTTIAFNFPYLDRGEENPSGDELIEEVEALSKVVELLQGLGYSKINLIAKSLGGIVSSFYLKRPSDVNFNLTILGFVVGDVKLDDFKGKLIVIQGNNDRFGNIDAVRQELETQGITNATLINIQDADHSYRDESKEPKFEDKAITRLFENIDKE